MPFQVKIDDKLVSELISVSSTIRAELNENNGDRIGFANPMRVVVTRDASKVAELVGFNACVKNPKKIKATIELAKQDGATAYTLNLQSAFVVSWRLDSSGEPGAPVTETIEISCGSATLAAAAASGTYLLNDFKLE